MFVEDGLSWDNEREATALDWPPLLTPELEGKPRVFAPRAAVVAADDAVAGTELGDDSRIVISVDPDLTEAELRATSIDSMVGAAFFPHEEAARATDVIVERPRRSSRSKRPLILVGAAVTVALSAGYAANARGWRLPAALLEAAQPMTTFFRDLPKTTFLRDLKTARLVDLMGKLRLAGPEVVPPIVGPMSAPDGAASEPMSWLEASQEQEVMMSSPASTPDSERASDEGRLAPVPSALLREVHPDRAREPNPRRRAESRRGVRSARREPLPLRARR